MNLEWTIVVVLFIYSLPNVCGNSFDKDEEVNSQCTGLVGSIKKPCIFPFEYEGQIHHRCAILDFDEPLLECPVTKDFTIWGQCDQDCYDNDMVELELEPTSIETEEPKQFPVQLAISINGLVVCGANLITPRHALTAAHCIKGPLSNVKVLVNKRQVSKTSKSQKIYSIEKELKHFEYENGKPEYDISILYLTNDVQFNKSLLVKLSPIDPWILLNSTIILGGWGNWKNKKEYFQYIPMEYEPPKQCHKVFKAVGVKQKSTEIQFCSTNERPDHKTGIPCSGDSGGGLLKESNGEYYIIGLLSIAHADCLPNIPALFTNISYFLPWITENIGLQKDVYEKGCTTPQYAKKNRSIACGIHLPSKSHFFEAQMLCEKLSASLPTISSAKENSYFRRFHLGTQNSFWIGVEQHDESNSFISSSTKTAIEFSNWGEDEPNGYIKEVNCVEQKKNGDWNDLNCFEKRNVICEKILIA